MKEGEKPGKFLLPHGIILLEFGPYRIFMEGNPEGIQNQRPLGIMELSVQMGVVLAIATMGLNHHDVATFERLATDSAEDIIQTAHPTSHEGTQQRLGVLIKGCP